MAIKIKGFDQITAWIVGIAFSTGIFLGVWYLGKYIGSLKQDQSDAKFAAAEAMLKNLPPATPRDSDEPETPSSHDAHSSGHPKPGSGEPFVRWGYIGNTAPWYWAGLNSAFAACGAKIGQSPIDISGSKLDERLKSLKFYYTHGITHLALAHQTVQGEVEHGSYLEWDGERFDLKRVLFRTPSEHRVNGLPWEMEIQLEHIAVTGKYIILSVMLTPGKSSPFINRLVENLPRMEDEVIDVERVNWLELLPAKRTYWSYIGSTTTPPCTPDSRWVILTDQVTTTKKSIDRLVMLQKSNVRPVQPLGKRDLSRSNR